MKTKLGFYIIASVILASGCTNRSQTDQTRTTPPASLPPVIDNTYVEPVLPPVEQECGIVNATIEPQTDLSQGIAPGASVGWKVTAQSDGCSRFVLKRYNGSADQEFFGQMTYTTTYTYPSANKVEQVQIYALNSANEEDSYVTTQSSPFEVVDPNANAFECVAAATPAVLTVPFVNGQVVASIGSKFVITANGLSIKIKSIEVMEGDFQQPSFTNAPGARHEIIGVPKVAGMNTLEFTVEDASDASAISRCSATVEVKTDANAVTTNKAGIHFEEFPGTQFSDYNDVVVCANGQFVLASGGAMISTKSQTINLSIRAGGQCSSFVEIVVVNSANQEKQRVPVPFSISATPLREADILNLKLDSGDRIVSFFWPNEDCNQNRWLNNSSAPFVGVFPYCLKE